MLNGYVQPQHALIAGEVSSQVRERTDVTFWQSAFRKGTNFSVNYHGGIKKRPGCRTIDEAASATGSVVLVEFIYSASITYCLEFTAGKIRFLQNGGFVVDDSDEIYSVDTDYTEDDLSTLNFTQRADVMDIFSPNHPIYQLERNGNADWDLVEFDNTQGPFEETNTDDSETIYSSGKSGTVTLTANFDAFTDDMVGTEVYLGLQSSGEITTWVQRTPTSVGDETYYDGNFYRAAEATKISDTTYSSGKALTGDTPPSHTSGSYWDGPNKAIDTYGYDNIIGVLWAYEHSGYGIVKITSVTSTTVAVGTTVVDIPSGIVGGNTTEYTQTEENQTTETEFTLDSSFTSEVIGDYSVTLEEYNSNGAPSDTLSYSQGDFSIDFEAGTLTLSAAPQYSETVDEVTTTLARNVVITQASEIRSTYYWAFEAWRETNGYPRCGAYYQQRLATAGTDNDPQTLWLSYLDAYSLYTIDNPVIAENAMSFQVDSTQVNEIQHMVSLNALLVFTSGSVWALNKGSNQAIDATDPPVINVQTYDGACEIPPILSGTQALYVVAGKQIIRDLRYDYTRDSFDGDDLTVRATHLFKNKEITSWAYLKRPDKQIWVSFDDGTFAILTYMKEQNVLGWTSGELSDGTVQYLTSVYEDNEDRIYAVIQRNSQNYVCRFASRQYTDRRNQFYMDMGFTTDGTASTTLTVTADSWLTDDTVTLVTADDYFDDLSVGQYIKVWYENTGYIIELDSITDAQNATGTLFQKIPSELQTELEAGIDENWGQAYTSFSGLDSLAGETIAVVGDGEVLSDGINNTDYVVGDDGTLSIPTNHASTIVHFGLPYQATLKTLSLEVSDQQNNYKSAYKRISRVGVVLNETTSIKGGQTLDNLSDIKTRSDEDFGQLPDEKETVVDVDIIGSWSKDASYYLVHDQPVQCEILALYPEVQTGG